MNKSKERKKGERTFDWVGLGRLSCVMNKCICKARVPDGGRWRKPRGWGGCRGPLTKKGEAWLTSRESEKPGLRGSFCS